MSKDEKDMDKGYRTIELTQRYEQNLIMLNKVLAQIQDLIDDTTTEYEEAYLSINREK